MMERQREVTSLVHGILSDHFQNVEAYGGSGFTLRQGSARAFVEVYSAVSDELPDEPVFVRITVPLLHGVSETPELHRYIAFAADDYRFGTLALRLDDQRGTCIFFCHTLLGDFLDDDELGLALSSMLGNADDLDDQLQNKFGGVRFHED